MVILYVVSIFWHYLTYLINLINFRYKFWPKEFLKIFVGRMRAELRFRRDKCARFFPSLTSWRRSRASSSGAYANVSKSSFRWLRILPMCWTSSGIPSGASAKQSPMVSCVPINTKVYDSTRKNSGPTKRSTHSWNESKTRVSAK